MSVICSVIFLQVTIMSIKYLAGESATGAIAKASPLGSVLMLTGMMLPVIVAFAGLFLLSILNHIRI